MNAKFVLKSYTVLLFCSLLFSIFFYASGVRFGDDAFEEIGFHFILLVLGGVIFGGSYAYIANKKHKPEKRIYYDGLAIEHHDGLPSATRSIMAGRAGPLRRVHEVVEPPDVILPGDHKKTK